MNTFNEYADYWRYEIGVNVIPANTKYKKPTVAWTEWQDTPIPKELHDKWKRENTFKDGMAIICGLTHHNSSKRGLYLCATDLDNGLAIKEMFPSGIETWSDKTLIEMHMDDSSKAHIYFYTRTPVPKKSSDTVNPSIAKKIKNNEIPAIEVKGEGKHGIMYCSPSIHKNGVKYEILGVKNPMIFDDLPVAVNKICKKHGISYLNIVKDGSAKVPMSELVAEGAEIHEGHNRHEAVMRYMESKIAINPELDDDEVYTMGQMFNQKHCKPPLDEGEIDKQCKCAIQYMEQHRNPQEEDTEKKKKHASDYADELLMDYFFATLPDTDEILIYDEGVYIPGGETRIKVRCEQIIKNCTQGVVNEVLHAIRRRTYTDRKLFDCEINMINMKNCWFDMSSGETFSHSPQKLSKIKIPIFFDSTKLPIKLVKFLEECHPGDTKTQETLWEQFASCFLKTAKFGKAFMYVGEGSNGKSVFLNTIKTCLGFDNISHKSIHTLEDNRFAAADLDGKLANLYNDISSEELNSSGTFKNLVTGDPISAEKKNQHSFTLNSFAKLFFSTNQIPKVYDESDGFFRRFMLVEWNRKFSDKEANVNLIEELTTEEEKSGIFNKLMTIANELEKRGHYSHADSVSIMRTKWKNKADSVNGFLNNWVIFENEEDGIEYKVDKIRFYDKYTNYCKENKLFPLNKKEFRDEIKYNSVLEEEVNPTRITGKDEWCAFYKGIEKRTGKKIVGKQVRVWKNAMLKADLIIQGKVDND